MWDVTHCGSRSQALHLPSAQVAGAGVTYQRGRWWLCLNPEPTTLTNGWGQVRVCCGPTPEQATSVRCKSTHTPDLNEHLAGGGCGVDITDCDGAPPCCLFGP